MEGRDKTLRRWATRLTAIEGQNQGKLPRIADASLTALHHQKTCSRILRQVQLETQNCRSAMTEEGRIQ